MVSEEMTHMESRLIEVWCVVCLVSRPQLTVLSCAICPCPSAEPSADDLAEWSKRIVEVEVFQAGDDLLSEPVSEEVKEAPKVSKYASKNSRAPTGAGGIDTTIFRYMYQNDDDLRDGLDANLVESHQLMMDKPEYAQMRMIVKSEKPTLAATLVAKPMKQTEIVIKKEVIEEKKEGDAATTPTPSPDASTQASAASQDASSTPAASSATAASAATPSPSSTPAASSASAASTTTSAAAAGAITIDDDDAESSNLVPLVSIGASKSQQSVILAGRVVYDANDTSGETSSEVVQKLLATNSVFIEGDKQRDNGARIQVRLNGLKSYSLFPGQAIIAKGINATGASFVAEEIVTDASLPHLGVKRSSVERFNGSLGFRPLGIMFAAGPFTTTEDLSFAPLFDLVREALRVRPDVLILQGPFIDQEHKELVANEGSVTHTYDVLFVRLIADVMAHFAHLRTKVIIMPSVRDAAAIPIFPQPPFASPQSVVGGGSAAAELRKEMESGKLLFVPNPCTLRINDITIACSSMDVILHMCNSNEVHKAPPTAPGAPEPPGRLQRLASHLLSSHSFYPLFPAPESVYLDYSHASSLRMPVTPDLLFLPSKMRHFAAEIESSRTIVVNPEFITKGPNGGTYALVSIHPLKVRQEQSGRKER